MKILWYICTYLARSHTHTPTDTNLYRHRSTYTLPPTLSDVLKRRWGLKAIKTVSAHHQQPISPQGKPIDQYCGSSKMGLNRGDFLPSSSQPFPLTTPGIKSFCCPKTKQMFLTKCPLSVLLVGAHGGNKKGLLELLEVHLVGGWGFYTHTHTHPWIVWRVRTVCWLILPLQPLDLTWQHASTDFNPFLSFISTSIQLQFLKKLLLDWCGLSKTHHKWPLSSFGGCLDRTEE